MALALSVITLVSMAGCGGDGGFKRDSSSEYDPNKRYLNIGNFNGGLGYAWLEEVANNYMAEHEDVVIKINNDKDGFAENILTEKMEEYGNDLYFINGFTYDNLVSKGLAEDVTKEVTEIIEGEGRSIEDKLYPSLKKIMNKDGKYYGLPFFDAIFGTVYDVDLFDQYGFYFDADGNFIGEGAEKTNLSAGPNGIAGDYDDGLPATISQWKSLLQEIKGYSMTPYTWTGEYEYYRYRWLASVWADYEGKEAFDLNNSLNGEYTFPGDTAPTKITIENAYRLQEQPGKLFALEMAEHIIRNNYYQKTAFDSVNTHTMAQNDFLLSVEASQLSSGTQRIAMILEGGWWENEARAFADQMAKDFENPEYAFGQRKFGFMPAPKADDGSSAAGTTLISSTGNSMVFVASCSEQKELAKDFFKYAHTDESMRIFTRVTGSIRPFDYTIEESDKTQMTYYAQNMWDIYHNENTDISHVTLYDNELFTLEPSFLGQTNWWWGSTQPNGAKYQDAMYEMSQDSNLTAQAYFAGLQKSYTKANWDSQLSKYFK